MKNLDFRHRLGFALNGIAAALRGERSLRAQIALAIAAIVLLLLLRPAPLWWALVALAIGLVLAAELFNSALEVLIDRLHPDRHPDIRRAKDIAAGAVLITALAALAVAAALAVSLL